MRLLGFFSCGWTVASPRPPLAMLLMLGMAARPTTLFGQPAGQPQTQGVPWTGEAAVVQTTDQIAAEQAQIDRSGPSMPPNPRSRLPRAQADRGHLLNAPSSPPVTEYQAAAAVLPNGALLAPQTLGVNFTAATFNDSNDFPPDSMGAAGPTQYLLAINGRIRVFDKVTGAVGALDSNMDTFFNAVRDATWTSDPRVRFDRLSGRWFVTIINVYVDASGNITAPNRVLIAVSDGPTITGSTVWSYYFFRQDLVSPTGDSTCLSDYPTLGIDANALYIGVNQFCGLGTPGSFAGTAAFVVRKSSLLSGGPIVVTAFRNLVPSASASGPYTPQGVDNYDPAAATGYVIGVDALSPGLLVLRRISNPGGTPSISGNINITVPSTSNPITVPHLGNAGGNNGQLDAIDDRLFAAHVRNGHLWTAHNIGLNSSGTASSHPSRDGVRWYHLQNLDTTPSLVESGTIYDSTSSNPLFYWIPTVMVSGQGHIAFGFSVAGNNSFADAGTTGRLVGGTVQTPVKYTTTASAYNPPGDPGGTRGRRWGDFSYTSLDPADDMTMWTIQEFTASTNIWGVRVVKLLAPAPTLNNPAVTACTGTMGLVIPLTGTGFYDPGAGFNRLAVSLSGTGVTVTNVTYTSPTSASVTVNIDPAAPAGAQNIILTNPDGQTATAAGGLTINSRPTPAIAATPSADVCTGTTVTLDVGAGYASYAWSPVSQTTQTITTTATGTYGVTVTNGGCSASTSVVVTEHASGPADFNQDCHVDAADLLIFQACGTGPGVAYDILNLPVGCTVTPDGFGIIGPDLDRDGDVDDSDFAIFQRCISGSSAFLDPACN